jgi:hypothetical protein
VPFNTVGSARSVPEKITRRKRRHFMSYLLLRTKNNSKFTTENRSKIKMSQCTTCSGQGVVKGIICPECGGGGETSKRTDHIDLEVSTVVTCVGPSPLFFVLPRATRLTELSTANSTRRDIAILKQQAKYPPLKKSITNFQYEHAPCLPSVGQSIISRNFPLPLPPNGTPQSTANMS